MVIHQADEPRPEEVATARRAFREWLAANGIDVERSQTAVIVLSELVTNAVRHARTGFTVDAEVVEEGVRVEVFDGDTRPPALQAADGDAVGGRGMQIVAAISVDWGTQSETRADIAGKLTWAIVAFDEVPPSS